jgi:hypothetical protein
LLGKKNLVLVEILADLITDFRIHSKEELRKYYTIAADRLAREFDVLVPTTKTSVRTNNKIESYFRSEKQKIRKTTGNRMVSQVLRHRANVGGLLQNMTNQLYIKTILTSPVNKLRDAWKLVTEIAMKEKTCVLLQRIACPLLAISLNCRYIFFC